MEPVPLPLHRLNKNRCSGQVQERVFGFPGPFSEVKVWRPTTFSLSSAMRFQRQRRRGFCLQEPGGGQYMPAFTLAGEAFCSVWTSTFHSLSCLCALCLCQKKLALNKKKLSQVGGCIAGAACKVAASRRLTMLHSWALLAGAAKVAVSYYTAKTQDPGRKMILMINDLQQW